MNKGVGKRFWTAKEAADYVSVTVWTLLAWCRGKKSPGERAVKLIGPPPPFRRFGRNCIRFPIAEFITWADAPTTPKKH